MFGCKVKKKKWNNKLSQTLFFINLEKWAKNLQSVSFSPILVYTNC